MDTSFTLESLRVELDNWRSTRTKQGRIPDDLWTKAISLLGKYSMSQLSRELRVSNAQIRAKLNLLNKPKSAASEPFIEVPIPSLKHESTEVNLGSRIEIKRADGASMVIEHLNEQSLSNLLSKFMRDL
jgi:hypothetical protein